MRGGPGYKQYGSPAIGPGRFFVLALDGVVLMMSFPIGGAPDDRRPSAEGEEPTLTTPDPALLEQVLEETLSEAAVSHLDAADLQALGEVARRFRGAALEVDPIVIELVRSLLKTHFTGFGVSDTLWHEVSQQIATTLFEAPDTRAKLERFWSQLSELVT